jgi:hypothetical protein
MQVSSQTNNYQDLSVHQKPVTLPEEGQKPSDTELSPETKPEIAEKSQEEKDQLRGVMVNQLEHQSKKTQVEIYLSVAADSKVEVGGSNTIDSLNTLRDVQKQNNTVAAYATYQENQNGNMASQLGA